MSIDSEKLVIYFQIISIGQEYFISTIIHFIVDMEVQRQRLI